MLALYTMDREALDDAMHASFRRKIGVPLRVAALFGRDVALDEAHAWREMIAGSAHPLGHRRPLDPRNVAGVVFGDGACGLLVSYADRRYYPPHDRNSGINDLAAVMARRGRGWPESLLIENEAELVSSTREYLSVHEIPYLRA